MPSSLWGRAPSTGSSGYHHLPCGVSLPHSLGPPPPAAVHATVTRAPTLLLRGLRFLTVVHGWVGPDPSGPWGRAKLGVWAPAMSAEFCAVWDETCALFDSRCLLSLRAHSLELWGQLV